MLCLLAPEIVRAGFPTPIDPFDVPQGAYQAEFVRDLGNIVQVRFAGDYNRSLPDGSFNRSARAVVAREFYQNHSDDYDILFVFTDFPVDTGDAAAFHYGIRNNVQGIGIPQFDISNIFGSEGKLGSYIDLADVERWELNPAKAENDELLSVAMHEMMHRWGVSVRVMDNGQPSDVLKGYMGSHWSPLMDTDASVMYGADWIPGEEGRYVASEVFKRYSALDLYLAGFYSAEETGSFSVLNSSQTIPAIYPSKGTSIDGSKRSFSVADIVAIEGERIPSHENSQKQFKAGVILLTSDTSSPDVTLVSRLNQFAEEVAVRFAHSTGGRAYLNVVNSRQKTASELDDSPLDLRDSVNKELAFHWLKSQQNAGAWQDSSYTTVRDSVTADRVLTLLDEDYSSDDFGLWLLSQAASVNNDDRAFLSRAGDVDERAMLSGTRNSDAGWGLRRGFLSTVFDTATVLNQVPMYASKSGISFILSRQNDDGGWPRENLGRSDFKTTALVLEVLTLAALKDEESGIESTILKNTVNWLSAYIEENVDIESLSTADLAIVLTAATRIKTDATQLIAKVSGYLTSLQQDNGSWSGSSYNTALVLEALASTELANLTAIGSHEGATKVIAGSPVSFTTRVSNEGAIDAGEFKLGLYLNDVTSENLVAEKLVPSLASGVSRSFEWIWEAGNHHGIQRLIVVVDSSDRITEKTKSDNQFFIDVDVKVPGSEEDIAVFSSDTRVSPDEFDAHREQLTVSTIVRNLSIIDSNGLNVSLWGGDGVPQVELGRQIVSVPATATIPINFSIETSYFSSLFIRVESTADVNLSNNQARINLQKKDSRDLVLDDISLLTQTPYDYGKDIELNVLISDNGTTPSPAATVSLIIQKDGQVLEKTDRNFSLSPGEQISPLFKWRPTESGSYLLLASVDDANLVTEVREDNNQYQLPLEISLSDKPNLNLTYRDIQVVGGLSEGSTAEFKVKVRNTGHEASDSSIIQLFLGNPDSNGTLLTEANVPSLGSEEFSEISLFWDNINTSGQQLIYVKVDPSNSILEAREEDNTAFIEVNIDSIADLFVTSELLDISPSVVPTGTPASINVTVANTGGKEVENVVFELFSQGQSIGQYSLGAIPEYSNSSKVISLNTDNLRENTEFVVVVDPENLVVEGDETNNEARSLLVIGNSDLYISESYISPNGDGKQDFAELFATIVPESGQRLSIFDVNNDEIASFPSDTKFPIDWYGSVDEVRLADGEYTLAITTRDGNRIATVSVIIDTNSTPVSEALASDYKLQIFYRELFGNLAWLSPYADGQRVIFYVNKVNEGQKLIPGIYSADFAGGDIRLIALESALEFSRPRHYGTPNYFNFISVASDGRSALLESHDNYYNAKDTFLRIDLQSSSYESVNLFDEAYSANKKFWYEYQGTIFGVYYSPYAVRLVSVNPSNGYTTSLSSVSVLSVKDSNPYRLKLVDEDTALFANTLISFKNRTAYSYQSNNEGIAYHNGRVARGSEAGELIISDLNGENEVTFPSYTNRNLKNSLQYAAFNKDMTKLMLYLVDPTPLVSGGSSGPEGEEGGFIGELGGFVDYVGLYDTNTNQDDAEPMPNGYRVELDLLSGEYKLRSYFSRYVSMDGEESPPVHYEFFTGQKKIEEEFYRYGWSEKPVAFEGRESGGVYLSNSQYLEKSLYLRYPNTEQEGSDWVVPGFFPYAIESREADRLQPFGTGFIFESLEILENGSILFANSEQYKEQEASNFMPSYRREQVADSLFLNTLNLTSYLKFVFDSDNQGVGIQVLATDKNFLNFEVEYRLDSESEWSSIVLPTNDPKRNDFVTTWVPPSEGTYSVRLTTRDKAGNINHYSRKLIWSYGANITDITLSDNIFSPDLDGVKDSLNLNFRVLRPSNLPFVILAEDGTQVAERTVPVDQVGTIQSITWNGRNDAGSRVIDGVYKLYLDGYLYYTIVDTKIPEVINKSENVKEDDENLDKETPNYYGLIDASATDENGIAESYFEKNIEGTWTLIDRELADSFKFESIAEFDEVSWRFVAIDEAGNKTVTGALEGIFLDRLNLIDIVSDHNLSKKSSNEPDRDSVLNFYAEFPANFLLEKKNSDNSTVIKLGYSQEEGYVDLGVIVSASVINQRISISSEALITAYEQLPNKPKKVYFYIQEGDDYYFSEKFNYIEGGRREIEVHYEGKLRFKIEELSEAKRVPYQVYLSSVRSGSRYENPVKVFTQEDSSESYTLYHVFEDLKLDTCEKYQVKFVFEDGSIEVRNFTSFCVDAKLSPIAPSYSDVQCNQVSSKLNYSLTVSKALASNGDQAKKEALTGISNLAVYAINVNRLDDKVYLYSGDYSLDTTLTVDKVLFELEGLWNLYVEVVFDDGHIEVSAQGEIAEDNRVPVVTLNSPMNGNNLCALSDRVKYGDLTWVEVQGAIVDYASEGARYVPTTQYGITFTSKNKHCSSGSPYEVIDPQSSSLCSKKLANSTDITNGDSSGILRQGILDLLFNVEGDQEYSYLVNDAAGNTACGVVNFSVDSRINFELSSIDNIDLSQGRESKTYGISPNGDGLHDNLKLLLDTPESVHLDIKLGGSKIFDGRVEKGTSELVINGTEIAVNDGVYALQLVATDDCGFSHWNNKFLIEVDTRSPDAEILYPKVNDELFSVTGVKVDLFDKNIASYTLDIKSAESESWNSLISDSVNVYSSSIYDLNLTGFDGIYQIRLTVEDKLANKTERFSELNVTALGTLLSHYEIDAKFISPNNDGVEDILSGSASVSRGASLDLLINKAVVASMSQLTLGEHNWNVPSSILSGMADGTYSLKIIAKDAKNANVSEFGSIEFTLDNTPPVFKVDDLKDGRFGILEVVVTDKNMSDYRYELRDENGVTVLTGSQNKFLAQDTSFIHNISSNQYLEGQYSLSYTLLDEAGNQTEGLYSFIYDKTPPVVNLSEPVELPLIFNQKINVFQFGYSFEEENPVSIELLLGSQVLYSKLDLDLVNEIRDEIDFSEFHDGEYSLTLIVKDTSGNEGSVDIQLSLDSHAPVIVIEKTDENNSEFIARGNNVRILIEDESALTGAVLIDGEVELSKLSLNQEVEWPTGLSDGHYQVEVQVTDAALNSSKAIKTFTQDTQPPVPVVAVSAKAIETSIQVSWSVSSSSDVSYYTVYRDGEKIATSDLVGFSDVLLDSIDQARYEYTVTAVDYAGNESDHSDKAVFVIDNLSPVVTILNPLNNSEHSGIIDFSAEILADDLSKVEASITVGGEEIRLPSSALQGGSYSFGEWDSFGKDGEAIFRIIALDESGNETDVSHTISLDNTPTPTPSGLVVTITDGNSVNASWQKVQDEQVVGYQLWRSGKDITGNILELSYVDKEVPDGSYRYAVVSVDVNGNISSPSEAVDVSIDIRAPDLTVVSPSAGDVFENSLPIDVSFSDKDIVEVQITLLDSSGVVEVLSESLTFAPYGTVLTTDSLLYDEYLIRIKAIDAAGNISDYEQLIKKVDKTPPAAVSNLFIKNELGVIVAHWDASTSNDVEKYSVQLNNEYGHEIANVEAEGTSVEFTSIQDKGEYWVTVRSIDTSANISSVTESLQVPYYFAKTVFPYTPVSEVSAPISVFSLYSGEVELLSDGAMFTSASVEDNASVTLAQDLLLDYPNKTVNIKYGDDHSVMPVSYKLERADKPIAPEALTLILTDADQVTVEMTSARNSDDFWFIKRNGHLLNSGAVHPSAYEQATFGIPGFRDSEEVHSEIDLGDHTWIKGFSIEYPNGGHDGGSIEYAELWNGVNWMRIPFIVESSDGIDIAEFNHPVFSGRMRILIRANEGRRLSVRWSPISTVVNENDQAVITGTSKYLNGIDAEGLTLTATIVSSIGAMGDESEALKILAHDNNNLDEIILQAQLVNGLPVLSWNTNAGAYEKFWLVHNESNQTEVLADGSGTYQIDNPIYVNGLNQYQVIAVTDVGQSRSSSVIDVSLTLDSPMSAQNLSVIYNEVHNNVEVTWVDTQLGVRFNVYRKHLLEIDFTLISTSTSNSFIDTQVLTDSVYQYYVVVVNGGGVSSHPTPALSIVTATNSTAPSPVILLPASDYSTIEEATDLLIAAVPNQQVQLLNNQISVHSYIANPDSNRIVNQFNYVTPMKGFSQYWAAEEDGGLKDLYSADNISWVPFEGGDLVYKGGATAYVNQWGELTRYRNGSNRYIAEGVSNFDVDKNDKVFAFTGPSGFEIRYGDNLSESIVLGDAISQAFSTNRIAVSPDGNKVAVANETDVVIIDVANPQDPIVSELTPDLLEGEPVNDLAWLNEDRLAIVNDQSLTVVSDAGQLIYKTVAKKGGNLQFSGFYGAFFVVMHYVDGASQQSVEILSIDSGKSVYEFSLSASEVSEQPIENFISAYGLLCSSVDYSLLCRQLPGVDKVELELTAARNEFKAATQLPDGRQFSSEILTIHRDMPDLPNVEVLATSTIRSIERSSDINIEVRQNSGEQVLVNDISVIVHDSNGVITEDRLTGFPSIMAPGEVYNYRYSWNPPGTGQYKIEVRVEANDVLKDDNLVSLSAVIADVNEAKFELQIIDGQHINIDLDTQAFAGSAKVRVKLNSYVGEHISIIDEGNFFAYSSHGYVYTPVNSDAWRYGFDLVVELLSEGIVIAERELKFNGDLLPSNNSEVSLQVSAPNIIVGDFATLTYRLTIEAPYVFSGKLEINALSNNGDVYSLKQQDLSYLFDGEVIEQAIELSDALLPVGTYQVIAELKDSDLHVISTDAISLSVLEAPVSYSGKVRMADTTVGMGGNLSASIEVGASISNAPELIRIILSSTGLEQQVLGEFTSDELPYSNEILLPDLTSSLGSKAISLSVIAVGRGEQLLDTLTIEVIDIVSPVLQIVSPAEQSFINAYDMVEVSANDAHSGIERVELRIGGNSKRTLIESGPGYYQGTLADLTEGVHSLEIVAFDLAENLSSSGIITVTMDKTLPDVVLSGAVNDAVYNQPVVVSALANDDHLHELQLFVNNQLNESSTVALSDDGDYLINAIARDKANNLSRKHLAFTIDQTAPEIQVTGIQDGAAYSENISYSIAVADDRLDTVVVKLNGIDVPSNGLIDEDGEHSLVITASDTAGNSATVTLEFLIDTLAPPIPTINLIDGQQLETALVSVEGVGEAGSRLRLRQNGALIETTITESGYALELNLDEGSNSIEFWAVDAVGNESEHTSLSISLVSLPEFEVVASETPLTRALIWVPWYDLHSDKTKAFIQAAMADANINYYISSSESDFKAHLRSQNYTVVVLMHTSHVLGLPSGFSVSMSSELRAMVSQGLGLVAVSNQISLFDIWEDVYGLRDSRADVKARRFILNDELLGSFDLELNGLASRVYTASDAVGLGEFKVDCLTIFHCREIREGNYPGLVDHYYGEGRVMTSSYDLAEASPVDDARRLLSNMILRVAPSRIAGYKYQWRKIEVVTAADTLPDLDVELRYDSDQGEVWLNNQRVLVGDTMDLPSTSSLYVEVVGEDDLQLEMDIYYQGDLVRTETVVFESQKAKYASDWQSLLSFVDNMEVPWYKMLTHLIMENDLVNSSERVIEDQHDIDYIRFRLLNSLSTTKTEFGGQSEEFAKLAGRLIILVQSEEDRINSQ